LSFAGDGGDGAGDSENAATAVMFDSSVQLALMAVASMAVTHLLRRL